MDVELGRTSMSEGASHEPVGDSCGGEEAGPQGPSQPAWSEAGALRDDHVALCHEYMTPKECRRLVLLFWVTVTIAFAGLIADLVIVLKEVLPDIAQHTHLASRATHEMGLPDGHTLACAAQHNPIA